MSGLRPVERVATKPRGGVFADCPDRCQPVNPIAPEDSHRYHGRHRAAIHSHHASHAEEDAIYPQPGGDCEQNAKGYGHFRPLRRPKKSGQKHRCRQQPERPADQSLPVAPQPIAGLPTAAPTIAFPGLQPDSRHPAGPLPDRRPERLGEVFARSHKRAAGPLEERHERLPEAQLVEPQTVLVILGQASGNEDLIGVLLGQRFEGAPAVARADARRRDERSERRSHGQVASMHLGEFVTIDSVSQRKQRSLQSQNGNLNKIEASRNEIVDPPHCLRMNNVLGVVGDDGFILDTVNLFVDQHLLIDPIQAIRFGSRSGMGYPGDPHLGETPRRPRNRFGGERIVRVYTHKHGVAGVLDRRQIMGEHLLDHLMLVPQRNEDRDLLFGRLIDFHRGWRDRWAKTPPPPPDQIDGQIVQAAEDEEDDDRNAERDDPGSHIQLVGGGS